MSAKWRCLPNRVSITDFTVQTQTIRTVSLKWGYFMKRVCITPSEKISRCYSKNVIAWRYSTHRKPQSNVLFSWPIFHIAEDCTFGSKENITLNSQNPPPLHLHPPPEQIYVFDNLHNYESNGTLFFIVIFIDKQLVKVSVFLKFGGLFLGNHQTDNQG